MRYIVLRRRSPRSATNLSYRSRVLSSGSAVLCDISISRNFGLISIAQNRSDWLLIRWRPWGSLVVNLYIRTIASSLRFAGVVASAEVLASESFSILGNRPSGVGDTSRQDRPQRGVEGGGTSLIDLRDLKIQWHLDYMNSRCQSEDSTNVLQLIAHS